MKKILCIVLSIIFCVTLFAGCKDSAKTESAIEKNDDVSSAPPAKPIETNENIVGIWLVEIPFEQRELDEACEEAGIKPYKTNAKNVFYMEFKEDLTCGFAADINLQLDAFQKGLFEFYSEFYSHIAEELGEAELQKILGNWGCEFFNIIIEKKLLDTLKENKLPKADDPETILAFQDLAYDVIKDYADAPIWVQFAFGNIFAEVFEDVGHDFVYRNGKWITNGSYYSSKWSFQNGILTIGDDNYTLSGDTYSFQLSGKGQFDSIVFTRIEAD